jgi:hypothetical protein
MRSNIRFISQFLILSILAVASAPNYLHADDKAPKTFEELKALQKRALAKLDAAQKDYDEAVIRSEAETKEVRKILIRNFAEVKVNINLNNDLLHHLKAGLGPDICTSLNESLLPLRLTRQAAMDNPNIFSPYVVSDLITTEGVLERILRPGRNCQNSRGEFAYSALADLNSVVNITSQSLRNDPLVNGSPSVAGQQDSGKRTEIMIAGEDIQAKMPNEKTKKSVSAR